MDGEVREFERLCRVLSEHRRICTGNPLDLSQIDSWPRLLYNEAEFTSLVLAAHKLWRETWKLDVGFLLSLRRADIAARDFDDLVYQLRTAQAHADNIEATTRWHAWTSKVVGEPPTTENDWSACGRALMANLNAAISCLCRIAADERRHVSFRQAWQAKIADSVESVVTAVADDLGMFLSPGRRAHHVREVERRWSKHRLRQNETALDVLASFAERSLISSMDPLPCDYQRVLDELRVLGTGDAIAALHLAHAVAEISHTTGETYLKLVESMWAVLRPSTST